MRCHPYGGRWYILRARLSRELQPISPSAATETNPWIVAETPGWKRDAAVLCGSTTARRDGRARGGAPASSAHSRWANSSAFLIDPATTMTAPGSGTVSGVA